MKLSRVANLCLLTTVLLAAVTAAAKDESCDVAGLVGAWTMHVTPQPNPDVDAVPPPFTALFVFETGGTFSETDTGFHPTSAVVIFPEFGALSGSDGLGAWKADGGNHYHGKFIKHLFDASGAHVGFIITRISITLHGRERLEASSDSAFVPGEDMNAEPFFTGGLTLATGTRLRAD